MLQRVLFYEDEQARQFLPIAHLRPVFELLCGHFSLRERVLRLSQAKSSWGAVVRPLLEDCYREQNPEAHVNDFAWIGEAATVALNGRWLSNADQPSLIEPGTAGWIDDQLVWVVLDPGDCVGDSFESFTSRLETIAKTKRPITLDGCLIKYPWHLIEHNPQQLVQDFESRDRSAAATISDQTAIVGPEDRLFVDPSADVDPFVVFDTRHGPIWIDRDVKLQAFTRIEGPAFVGRKTQTFRANIREGTSIGPVCRVGGEIEESILHGFVNKYHDGFLGHSYVCPWVNLGALTTNSDLKNDYSNVSVPLVGESVPSASNKVGCFIGDHTKTALSSLFNTGSSIGVMCLILPGGELLPKHVPSFSRVWHGRLEELPDQTRSGLQTARYALDRRGQELSAAMEQTIQKLFAETAGERSLAFARQAQRSQ